MKAHKHYLVLSVGLAILAQARPPRFYLALTSPHVQHMRRQ